MEGVSQIIILGASRFWLCCGLNNSTSTGKELFNIFPGTFQKIKTSLVSNFISSLKSRTSNIQISYLEPIGATKIFATLPITWIAV